MAGTRDTVTVFAAASLSAPLLAVRDSFARRTGAVVREEHGGSLELARRVTELHRVPDVIALADQEVFSELLVPRAARWYARFATNRMVVAFTARSRHAAEMDAAGWWRTLLRDDVLVGRTDPELAPAGYRALITFALAEGYYHEPGLAARLTAHSPRRLQRGNAAELAALLEAGELDYIVDYESLARAHGFRWVRLPPEIDLGDASHAARYATAAVRVRSGRDSITRRGAPILYGVSVPSGASHPAAGARFVALLLGREGRAMMRRQHVESLARPELVGDSVPAVVRDAVAQSP
ncbi:MAG: extracellular solute-binding protein family 1 [Gemmatimonadetes bacterium]|jgi:molybdate/tungstate transport system substrate-binding protein|nr:extracellular solute-binding protein family 1 [Gemmatimonadota bacterium]